MASPGIDIVVVIEAVARKSSWTRDEIAKAQSPDVFLIPLVEDGAVFDKGIFGDHEYLSFTLATSGTHSSGYWKESSTFSASARPERDTT